MEYYLIPLTAFVASLLTFFSGFGLGTILTPVFAIFFPIDLSIAMTAIVHFTNNVFKLVLVGPHMRRDVLLRFGLTAIVAALLGARILVMIADQAPLFSYEISGKAFEVSPVKFVVAILVLAFTWLELLPQFQRLSFGTRYLPIGGALSGFFGGLSGHQGALRSAFLIRLGLSKEQFIATGVAIACLVDTARMIVYAGHFKSAGVSDNRGILVAAILAAFVGAYLGNRLLKKVTLRGVQLFVALGLSILALALGAGWI